MVLESLHNFFLIYIEVSPYMWVLKTKFLWHMILDSELLWSSNHVVVLCCSLSLEETGDGICHIFSRPMWIGLVPSFEPGLCFSQLITFMEKENTYFQNMKERKQSKYWPAGPVFSPNLRTIWVVRREVITVETIASVDLQWKEIKKICINFLVPKWCCIKYLLINLKNNKVYG